MGTLNISVGFMLSGGAVYSSIGTNIVFSMCLGSQALRTKNLHSI